MSIMSENVISFPTVQQMTCSVQTIMCIQRCISCSMIVTIKAENPSIWRAGINNIIDQAYLILLATPSYRLNTSHKVIKTHTSVSCIAAVWWGQPTSQIRQQVHLHYRGPCGADRRALQGEAVERLTLWRGRAGRTRATQAATTKQRQPCKATILASLLVACCDLYK